MELRELWVIVRRRWWLIALPTLGALALALYGLRGEAAGGGYTTSMRFTAATPPEDADSAYEDSQYYPWLTSEYVVNALTDWVRTGSYATEVSEALAAQDVDIPASAIQGVIAADNERSVLVISLSWPDADQLNLLSAAAAAVLEIRSPVYFPQFGTGGVTVVALDEPVITPVPPSLSSRLEPLIRVALGLVAGIGLAFLVEYLDPTVHQRREVEAMGVPVLAEVPRDGV